MVYSEEAYHVVNARLVGSGYYAGGKENRRYFQFEGNQENDISHKVVIVMNYKAIAELREALPEHCDCCGQPLPEESH